MCVFLCGLGVSVWFVGGGVEIEYEIGVADDGNGLSKIII